MSRFDGQVVVVTGGARGIGRVTGEAFAAAGARVVAWDSKPSAQSGEVRVEEVDVRSSQAVERAAAGLLAAEGRIDVLINNAGVNFGDQSLAGLSDELWQAILDTNLKGAVNAVRALAPAMVEKRRGRIVNTGSVLATHPHPLFSAYAASKAALLALTRAWAQELGPHGVTVNAVSPGFIDTPMNAGLSAQVKSALIARTPLGRMGRAEEVAEAHLFLASQEAGFVNGAVLPVDGGLTI